MASESITRDLYNGLYHMIHNPNARGSAARYTVTEGEKVTKPKGVTTILGQTLAKDFVQWAVDACCDYLRTKLPLVTEEDLTIGAKEYTRLRNAGGDTGTEAHAMVETYLKQGKVKAEGTTEAVNAVNAFITWFKAQTPDVLGVEDVIYSRHYEYAGTYDCMLKVNGKIYLCDLKTTNPSRKAPNGVYAENFIQLGAYAMAYEEQRQYELADGGSELSEIEGLMVISAKKNGVLDIVTNEDLGLTVSECSEMFKRVVNIYQFMNYATGRLGGR